MSHFSGLVDVFKVNPFKNSNLASTLDAIMISIGFFTAGKNQYLINQRSEWN